MRCRHAAPLLVEYQRRTKALLALSPSSSLGCPSMGAMPFDTLVDVSFLVGPHERQFAAHRVLLAARSKYFEKLLIDASASDAGSGAGAVGGSPTCVIRLPHVEPAAFAVILSFVYDRQVDLGVQGIQTICTVFSLCESFGLGELKSLCEDRLCGMVELSTLPTLMRVAVGLDTPLDDDDMFGLHGCGCHGGESLLRACRSHVLANLGSLEELDCSDTLTMTMLAANHHRVLP